MRARAALPAFCALVVLSGCGASRATTADAERAIRENYPPDGTKVDKIDCIKRTDKEARCLATVSGADAEGDVSFSATLGENGKVLWEVEKTDLAPSPAAISRQQGAESDAASSQSLYEGCIAGGGGSTCDSYLTSP